MKNVLFVMPTMLMGGAEKSLVTVLQSIDKEKYKIDLLLFSRIGPLLKEIPEWVTVYEADEVSKAMILEFRKYFSSLLKDKRISAAIARILILIVNEFERKTGRKLGLNWVIARRYISTFDKDYDVAIGYLEGVTDFYVIDKVKANKKIAWIHSDLEKAKVRASREIQYYKQFDTIVTISETCLESFVAQFPKLQSRIQVVKNIVSEERVLVLAEEQLINDRWQSNINLVTVGRLEPVKGLDLAIDACGILVRKGYNVTWYVYGEGYLRNSLQERINKLGIQNNFILEGIIQNPYPYMKRADIIVQTSRYEGKSLVLDEAKILGKPIISTNYPTVYDQLKDKQTGIIVEMSAESIAKAICELLSNEVLRNNLQTNCRNERNESYQEIGKIYKIIEG